MSKRKKTPRKVSRQWKWSQKQMENGCCRICGKKRNRYKNVCDSCQKKVQDHRRKKSKEKREKINR